MTDHGSKARGHRLYLVVGSVITRFDDVQSAHKAFAAAHGQGAALVDSFERAVSLALGEQVRIVQCRTRCKGHRATGFKIVRLGIKVDGTPADTPRCNRS